MKWDLICSALLTLPVFLINMVVPKTSDSAKDELMAEVGGVRGLLVKDLVSFLLTVPIQFWFGRRFSIGAYHALKNGRANMVRAPLATSVCHMHQQ